MEEARQKNSQDMAKTLEMLEEWKKLWKKKIIQSYRKYFLSFSKKILEEWKKLGKKFRIPCKNSGNVGRMEEARQRIQKTCKTLEMLEERKKLWKK